MAYTSKPLAFPKAKKLSDLFSSIKPRRYGTPGYKAPAAKYYGKSGYISSFCSGRGGNSWDVTPKQAVIDYIEKSMLPVVRGAVHFEIVKRDDGSKLVLVKYDQIIGSRYLALISKVKSKKAGAKKKLRKSVRGRQSASKVIPFLSSKQRKMFDYLEKHATLRATSGDRKLGLLLQGWHSSGGDPIYVAGSALYSGTIPPVDVLERAQIEIAQHMIDPRFAGEAFRSDARELKKIFDGLGKLIRKHKGKG